MFRVKQFSSHLYDVLAEHATWRDGGFHGGPYSVLKKNRRLELVDRPASFSADSTFISDKPCVFISQKFVHFTKAGWPLSVY